jgi:hypothetical protein
LTKRKVSAFGKSFRIVQLEKNNEETEMIDSKSKAQHESLKRDNSVFSLIQDIIGKNSSFHEPYSVKKTYDDDAKMSKSPSFL